MPSETIKFENGPKTYRIQFDVVVPPPSPPPKPGIVKAYTPKPQFTVASIRVTEITEGVGDSPPKLTANFGRGYDSLAQARTNATEYAKRLVREKMTPKPAAETPAAEGSGTPG
jgi:hypothetical protein